MYLTAKSVLNFILNSLQLDDKGRLEGERAAIRILDAALLNGDDVSGLPFDDRIAAAEKMCKAIRLTYEVPDRKLAPVFSAKVSRLLNG